MSTDSTDRILARDRERCQALLAADVGLLSNLLSDRLAFAHANAVYDDKASLLKKMESGTIVYRTLDVTGHRVIDLGDSALLISRLTAEVDVAGVRKSIDNWTLSVWTREVDDWRLVAYQPTPIPGNH